MDNQLKKIIHYIESFGLKVNFHTQARGNQGLYMKGRIDVSKNIPKSKIASILVHEFAHFVHSKEESIMNKEGGSLEKVFGENKVELIRKELIYISETRDMNIKIAPLFEHKKLIKSLIEKEEQVIKKEFPAFQRSKKFAQAEKEIKKTNAKWLLKYDAVQVRTGVFRKKEVFKITDIDLDFPQLKKEFRAFIRLKALQRKQKRISARILKYKKYYHKPTELFARFIECLVFEPLVSLEKAPITNERFNSLIKEGKYEEIETLRKIILCPEF